MNKPPFDKDRAEDVHEDQPDRFSPDQLEPELLESELLEIEQLIYDAQFYVMPGDQLRPRTLEAARDLGVQRRHVSYLTHAIVAVCLAFALLVPTLEAFSQWREQQLIVDAHEVQDRALQLSTRQEVGEAWSLYEAFKELRTHQRTKLGNFDELSVDKPSFRN